VWRRAGGVGRAGLGAVDGVPASGPQTLKAGTIDGYDCPGGPRRGAPRTDRGATVLSRVD
jgi:hypothetical protein